MGWGGVGMVSVGMVGVNGEGIGWVDGWMDVSAGGSQIWDLGFLGGGV